MSVRVRSDWRKRCEKHMVQPTVTTDFQGEKKETRQTKWREEREKNMWTINGEKGDWYDGDEYDEGVAVKNPGCGLRAQSRDNHRWPCKLQLRSSIWLPSCSPPFPKGKRLKVNGGKLTGVPENGHVTRCRILRPQNAHVFCNDQSWTGPILISLVCVQGETHLTQFNSSPFTFSQAWRFRHYSTTDS